MHYIIWLILSASSFAVGEFLSKKFALNPKFSYVFFILIAYCIGTLFWLPAILQKNQLSIVGTMWSVLGLLATVLIGVLIFSEKLSLVGIIGIVFAFISIILLSMSSNYVENGTGFVCIRDNCFEVEVAKTEAQRDRGLMNREELGRDKGMFFVFDKEGIYPFWMKNTLIPLDIIWADSNGKIVFISQNVQPCKSLICSSVYPNVKAKYVLEVNAGICESLDIKVGDQVNF